MSYDNLWHGGRNANSVLYDNHTQWRIKAENLLSSCNIFTPHATKKFPLGAIAESRDGRMWRYVQDDGTGVAKHKMCMAAVPDAQTLNVAQAAYAVAAGTKKFDTLITTANGISNSDLIDGYLFVNEGATGVASQGDMYIIKDNSWTTSDTVLNIEIADAGGLRLGIDAADNLNWIKNICKDVLITPSSALTGMAVGVTMNTVTASYYHWVQFRGMATCALDASDTVAIGEPVGYPGTSGTAGSVGTIANDGTDATWGTAFTITADYILCNLLLP